MKRFTVVSIAGLVVFSWQLFAVAEAVAARPKNQTPEVLFHQLDANNDGKLSKEEFAKISELRKSKKPAKPGKTDKLFSRLDTNADGFLSLDEFKKIGEHKGKKKKAAE